MIVKRIKSEYTPLNGFENGIDLFPGVNFVRGENGCGKTTVLECAALLGHLPVIPINQQTNSGSVVTLTVGFAAADIAALRLITEDRAVQQFAVNTLGKGSRFAAYFTSPTISEIAEFLHDRENSVAELDVVVEFCISPKTPHGDDMELKEILTKDSFLSEHFEVRSGSGDRRGLLALNALIAWSRPEVVRPRTANEHGIWRATPRTRAFKCERTELPVANPGALADGF